MVFLFCFISSRARLLCCPHLNLLPKPGPVPNCQSDGSVLSFTEYTEHSARFWGHINSFRSSGLYLDWNSLPTTSHHIFLLASHPIASSEKAPLITQFETVTQPPFPHPHLQLALEKFPLHDISVYLQYIYFLNLFPGKTTKTLSVLFTSPYPLS